MFGSASKVEFNLRHEELLTTFDLIDHILRRHAHEFVAESIFKRKHASLHELERVDELALKAKELRKVKKTFMMVKVALQKLYQRVDAH